MRITARADYAVRVMLELAARTDDGPISADALAKAQDIPRKFLENILVDLRRSGLVRSQRGAEGGYVLAADPDTLDLAEIVRVSDGPLAFVRDERPQDLDYEGTAAHLDRVWIALRASIRDVLESVTITQLLAGDLPEHVAGYVEDPEAWASH